MSDRRGGGRAGSASRDDVLSDARYPDGASEGVTEGVPDDDAMRPGTDAGVMNSGAEAVDPDAGGTEAGVEAVDPDAGGTDAGAETVDPDAGDTEVVDPDAGDTVASGADEGPGRAGRWSAWRARRPVHLRLRWVLLVVLGGTVGTAAREALTLAFPAPAGTFPLSVFTINVLGAFVLGGLLELLARSGPDQGARRAARLGLGTGMLGGFTTYSALAVDAALLTGSAIGVALLYLVGSVLVGTATAWAGVVTARALHGRIAA